MAKKPAHGAIRDFYQLWQPQPIRNWSSAKPR